MIQDQEFIHEFVDEARHHLEAIEALLIDTDRVMADGESINTIFRSVHSIKGTAGFFGLSKIVLLAHTMESVLDEVRRGSIGMDEKLVDIILATHDQLKAMVEDVLNSEEIDLSFLISQLNLVLNIENKDLYEKEKTILLKSSSELKINLNGSNYSILTDGLSLGHMVYEIKLRLNKELLNYKDGPVKLLKKIRAIGMVIDTVTDYSEINSFEDILDVVNEGNRDVYLGIIVTTDLEKESFSEVIDIPQEFIHEMVVGEEDVQTFEDELAYLEAVGQHSEEESLLTMPISIMLDEFEGNQKPQKNSSFASQANISVNIQKLDRLMDLVGELVISEAMVTGNPAILKLEIESFQKASMHHRKIISELKDIVMSVRMVPLAATFQKMNRIVRDVSQKLGKEVKLEILGEDTEVDKNIIENIQDPLLHLIRNSIDHGIEDPQGRKNKGKTQVSKVSLEAKNFGGDVIISVRDDGSGLDKEKIYRKAYSNGITNKTGSELSPGEIYNFIFMPGFSTQEKVTEFSGRGVGMDVVSRNIKKIGGTVDVDSTKDVGTSINIKIPLTLAIIEGMIITVGSSSYILPTINIKEAFKPKKDQIIIGPEGNEMIFIRGYCYPILRLHHLFNCKTKITQLTDGIILMTEDESGTVCVFADELIGEQQVVVKALPQYLKKIKGLVGCTLLGDGSISLIIDIGYLVSSI